ncbi:MAG: choice-of-anchor B family protein, partial [Flavobacteriales bacterium]|nr:choice-of-anchor B family protein [Flavobacteriales bacterium]
MKHLISVLLMGAVGALYAQTPCTGGFAGPYPCQNIDLLYFMEPDEFGGGSTNEVWGWVDPNTGKEYALLGKSNGVAFIDLSDPLNPVYLGTLPPHGANSIWRTLRVYNNYVFVGSEANGHGLQVFDLMQLAGVTNPPVAFTESAWYNGFGKCHTLVINEATGYLYACGTNTFSGGLHIVNIQNPLAPVLAGSYNLNGYTHEAQVLMYNGPDTEHQGKEIVFCYNGNTDKLVIVDATDKTDVVKIKDITYPMAGYPHQGWLDPTQRYLLMDDELDEYNGLVNNTRTLIWDLLDLNNPVYMGDYLAATEAVDHNQYIIGNLDFQSNYTAGLRILDITNIASASLTEVAYFDHFPYNDNPSFDGTWMNYPYFESGVIPVTDIDYGLFIVKPNFIQLSSDNFDVCSSESVIFDIDAVAGFAGPITYSISGIPGGATVNYSANGVTAPSTVTVTIGNLPNVDATYELEIVADGAHFSYSRPFTVHTNVATTWYVDLDSDGYGTGAPVIACSVISGFATIDGDCDDNNPYK